MKIRYQKPGWGGELGIIFATVLVGAFAAPADGLARAGTGEQQEFKAIWEPVNVPEDVELKSVHFVSADVGWVVGGKNVMSGGVIYHTRDGGQTWELQLGDLESSDRGFSDLRFVDATHGFVVQGAPGGGHTLFATADGQTWLPSGTVPEHRRDYVFTTPTTGFTDARGQILQTKDGGRSWQPVYACKVRAEIQGLTREAECLIERFFFVTPSLGYAISSPLPERAGNVLVKTEDGGTTWSARVVLAGETAYESSLWFTDPEVGALRTQDGKMFRTSDGGETWTGVSGQAAGKPDISFADAQVGWMIQYRHMVYTTNGGSSWTSREIPFPAMVEDSSMPARDRGYAIGPHGMVYRYRVVPADYAGKGAIAAPSLAVR